MKKINPLFASMFIAAGLLASSGVFADTLPDHIQGRVEKYKQKLVEWAATPAVVAAVKDANAKGTPAMTNAKWDALGDADPTVAAYVGSPVGKQLAKWEGDNGISKLYLRDAKGNLVAASSKPLLFNIAARPAFVNSIKGTPWAAGEIKPDPTTQKKSVLLAVPVLDGGKPAGVLHTAVDAE